MNKQLWSELTKEKIVSGEYPNSTEAASPWYVKVILAFSGWLAALFLSGFFFALFPHIYKEPALASSLGVSLIIGAFFLFKNKGNEFIEHLALAISLAGQLLLLLAFNKFYQTNEETMVWLSVAILQLILAWIMPNTVHRVFSSFIAGIGFAATLFYIQDGLAASTIYNSFLMLAVALLWLNQTRFPTHIIKQQAIAFGLTFALLLLNLTGFYELFDIIYRRNSFTFEDTWLQPWMREMVFGAVILYVVWSLLKKATTKVSPKTIGFALLGTVALSILSTQAHGLTVGVMVILLGFSISNRVLLGLGILSLLFFISHYYYSLQNTLLDKSITLASLGFGLLMARWLMIKLLPTTGEPA